MRSILTATRRATRFRVRTLILAVGLAGIVLLPIWQRASENRRSFALIQTFGSSLTCAQSPEPPAVARVLPAFASRALWPRHGDDAVVVNSRYRRLTIADNDLKDLYLFRHLRELSIPNSPVTDSGAQYIALLRELKVLDLSDSKITDDGVKKIAAITSLESLTVVGTAITDDGLEYLATMPNLAGLSVARTRITDRAAGILGRMRQLKALNVTETRFTFAGGTVLRRSLPDVEVWPSEVAPLKPGEVRLRAY